MEWVWRRLSAIFAFARAGSWKDRLFYICSCCLGTPVSHWARPPTSRFSLRGRSVTHRHARAGLAAGAVTDRGSLPQGGPCSLDPAGRAELSRCAPRHDPLWRRTGLGRRLAGRKWHTRSCLDARGACGAPQRPAVRGLCRCARRGAADCGDAVRARQDQRGGDYF